MVTGGASGIGRAVVNRILADGGSVVVGDLNEQQLADLTSSAHGRCIGVRCDVTDEHGPELLAATAIEHFGQLDLAVASAGGGTGAAIVDHSLADWQRVIALNLTGTFLTIQAAARAMTGPGSIVAMSSISAKLPAVRVAAYGAAKAGVTALAETAALELGPRGIRVNIVAPGLVRTPATEAMWRAPEMIGAYESNTFLGRYGTPDEIAAGVTYLLSDDAALVTGTTLFVDGGAQHLRYPDLTPWTG